MRKTKLKLVGDNDTATLKKEIQRLVRLIVTHRDGGCILRKLRRCNVEAFVDENQEIVATSSFIQADHLVTRANSATFADTRLIVCVCNGCHAWKNWNKESYDKLVRTQLSNATKTLWDKCEEARHRHQTKKMDWKMEILALQKELKEYESL
jgi:hypothetical protein